MKPRENPFRVERMHSLPFEPVGTSWDALRSRLEAMQWRGAIVGPHGSGKTTLLRRIAEELERGGRHITRLSLNDTSRGDAKRHAVNAVTQSGDSVILLDGYEQLSPMQRLRLARAKGPHLIVTAHRRTLLPTLIRTRTSPQLLATLVSRLVPGGVEVDVESLWRQHRGNVREAMMALYDRCAAAETPGKPGG